MTTNGKASVSAILVGGEPSRTQDLIANLAQLGIEVREHFAYQRKSDVKSVGKLASRCPRDLRIALLFEGAMGPDLKSAAIRAIDSINVARRDRNVPPIRKVPITGAADAKERLSRMAADLIVANSVPSDQIAKPSSSAKSADTKPAKPTRGRAVMAYVLQTETACDQVLASIPRGHRATASQVGSLVNRKIGRSMSEERIRQRMRKSGMRDFNGSGERLEGFAYPREDGTVDPKWPLWNPFPPMDEIWVKGEAADIKPADPTFESKTPSTSSEPPAEHPTSEQPKIDPLAALVARRISDWQASIELGASTALATLQQARAVEAAEISIDCTQADAISIKIVGEAAEGLRLLVDALRQLPGKPVRAKIVGGRLEIE